MNAELEKSVATQADLLDRANDPVGGYSFGMRRKLNILQALSVEPELLVFDEPTIGLDSPYLLALTEQIRERTRAGKTTWISGNCPELMEEVATRVAFLDRGRLCACAPVSEHLHTIEQRQELRLELDSPRRLDETLLPKIEAFVQAGSSVTILLDGDPLRVPKTMEAVIRQGARIAAVEVRRARLRDAFLLKTGQGLDSSLPQPGGHGGTIQ